MTEEIQKKLLRIRPPRVRISYDVDIGGAIEKKELPFIVGIFADLSGNRASPDGFPLLKQRKMIDICCDNFNEVMMTIGPRADLLPVLNAVPGLMNSADPCDKEIVFKSMDDFEPLRVVNALPGLRAKYQARCQLRSLQAKAESASASASEGSITGMDEQVAAIDQELSAALSLIMHSPNFKAMEQTWRGLHYLVSRVQTGAMLKLRVFDASKDELRADMEKAVEFDQSALFKLIYEAEYGTYGGYPYSLLVGGYAIDGSTEDIAFLKKMSEVAAAAHAPFIAAASCTLFGMTGYEQLGKPRDLRKIFESAELVAWREFRETEEARYVSLVLPRVLLRLPYGRPEKRNTVACDGFDFEEQIGEDGASATMDAQGEVLGYPAPDHAHFVWGNPAYVLAERIANAFALHGWTAAICGMEGGGLVESLPLYTYATDAVRTERFCPTEVSISDRRANELSELGFIALCHCKDTGTAAFFNSPTTQAPKQYFSDEANEQARAAAMLPYVLVASRFAHYIKVIMREKIGAFVTRSNVEAYLNNWISQYVLLDEVAAPEVHAAYPLRAAKVVVTETAGEPGVFKATVFVHPQHQFGDRRTSIRLVAGLPK